MTTQQPVWVCLKCGQRYRQSPMPEFVTFHMGDCGCCWESVPVTWAADFGYLRPEWADHRKTKESA